MHFVSGNALNVPITDSKPQIDEYMYDLSFEDVYTTTPLFLPRNLGSDSSIYGTHARAIDYILLRNTRDTNAMATSYRIHQYYARQ